MRIVPAQLDRTLGSQTGLNPIIRDFFLPPTSELPKMSLSAVKKNLKLLDCIIQICPQLSGQRKKELFGRVWYQLTSRFLVYCDFTVLEAELQEMGWIT